jgi:hypothetical protein
VESFARINQNLAINATASPAQASIGTANASTCGPERDDLDELHACGHLERLLVADVVKRFVIRKRL